MSIILIFLIIGFAVAAGTALVRGLMAFHQDAQHIRDGTDPSLSQPGIRQNRMMIQRVIFQGIAILLIAVFGLIYGKL